MLKNNILFIGENVDNVLNDIWKLNTNYAVIQCSDLKNRQFLDYVETLEHPHITYMTGETLQKKHTINDVVDVCHKINYRPIIISRDNKDLEHICYLALEDFLQDAIEYRLNEHNEQYDEFLEICFDYVKGCGTDDNSVSTSTGR